MRRITAHSRLIGVALASIMLGVLLGSGVAFAHTAWDNKVPGWKTYTGQHGPYCFIYDCNFDQAHLAWASSDFTVFQIEKTYYYNASSDDDLNFGVLRIWDERGEHGVNFWDFACLPLNGALYVEDTYWYWAGHDPPNYGTAATQYVWTGCPGGGAGAHELAMAAY